MSIRRGDRVMLKTAAGEVMVKELKWRTANSIESRSIDPRMSSARSRRARCSGSRAHRLGEPVRKAALGNQAAESNRQVCIPTLEGAP
jgi:hypothetical protein